MLTKTILNQSTPEAQGISSASILAFLDAVEQSDNELHGFIFVRHGQAIAKGWWSPYAADRPHMLFSLSKSFCSSAVGMAVAEGRLTVDDRVVDFFPDDLPAHIDENLAVMTVHNLLTMNTGHDQDATGALRTDGDGNWVKAFLSLPVEHKPGSKFVYNSAATYMCSAIVQKLTGQTLLEYLTPRLFEPLGIENPTWERCPRGINVGGWGLMIKTDDISKFGQLYLQQGQWQGQQLITPEWVAAATAKQVRNDLTPLSENTDWQQGYGYQFWRCRHNAYRGDGAFGQYCVVLPDQDAHFAINSGLGNMQPVLDFIWQHLLPAMQDAPLPEDAGTQATLAKRLASLSLRPQQGAATSPTAQRVSGKSYRLDKNEDSITQIKWDFDGNGASVTIQDKNGEHKLPVGYQNWIEATTTLGPDTDEPDGFPVALSGAWTADDTYTVRLSYIETPFIPTLSFRFVDDGVEYRKRLNVEFGPPENLERPVVMGKRV